mgnify:CR=1 FL=1
MFMAHGRRESLGLKSVVTDALCGYCDGRCGRPSMAAILAKPLARVVGGGRLSAVSSLLEAHCRALVTAVGLDAMKRCLDPPDQRDVMLWELGRLLVEEDVGPGNVGHAPSPRPRPGMHVSYAPPGTFVGGVPSQLQALTDRYGGRSALERVAILVLALGVVAPSKGVGRRVWDSVNLGSGIVGRNIVGLAAIDDGEVDEWNPDLVFTDVQAVVSDLPGAVTHGLVAAVGSIAPFWPAFSARSRLVY